MAIGKLESVPVDLAGAEVRFSGANPAMTRDSAGRDVPKSRDGVVGMEVDLLIRFPGDPSRSAAKITLYQPIPDIPDLALVQLVNFRANIWTSKDRAGGGMWFSADGIHPVEQPKRGAA